MNTIWLIGCGNIGFRHLQALLLMTEPTNIVVVEPVTALHERIKTEILLDRPVAHQVKLTTSLPESTRPELAIIATSAPPRAKIVTELMKHSPPNTIILEKILAQTDSELDLISHYLSAESSMGYVNCPRRYFPGYQTLKKNLANDRPLAVTVEGAQFGLASNAIHFFDIFEYINDSSLVSIDVSKLEPGGKLSKRAGFQEIYGTISARLKNGAVLEISCADQESVSLDITITTMDNATYHINESRGRIIGPKSQEEVFETRFVSQTPEIYTEALDRRCKLTTLSDSSRQHRLYLQALRKHFSLPDNQPVPIS